MTYHVIDEAGSCLNCKKTVSHSNHASDIIDKCIHGLDENHDVCYI